MPSKEAMNEAGPAVGLDRRSLKPERLKQRDWRERDREREVSSILVLQW